MQKVGAFLGLVFCLFFIGGCEFGQLAEVKKAKINDVEIAYYIRGTGEPLVMIMGFKGTMAVWDPALLDILDQKYKLILFDHRGAGLSSDSEENLTTIPQMAEDTVNLMKSLGIKSAHVLGWSMGTRIAIEMAVKYPEMVNTLILCAPNPGVEHSSPPSEAVLKLVTGHLSLSQGLGLLFPNTFTGNLAAFALFMRLFEAVAFGTVPYDFTVNHQTGLRQLYALEEWDISKDPYEILPKIKAPTLVAGGLLDVLDSPEDVQTVACRIPYVWSAYFPGAGHYFFSQEFEAFAKLMILFIETNAVVSRQ